MLTTAENELLTRIGPGTPMGDLQRRYWHLSTPTEVAHLASTSSSGLLPRLPGGSPPCQLLYKNCERLTAFINIRNG